MATYTKTTKWTTISLTKETRDKLFSLGKKGETTEDLLLRLLQRLTN